MRRAVQAVGWIMLTISVATLARAENKINRVQLSDDLYESCKEKVLNNAEAMAAFSQIGLSPDRPCRCYGDRMAAAVTEEEIDYAIEKNEMPKSVQDRDKAVMKACFSDEWNLIKSSR